MNHGFEISDLLAEKRRREAAEMREREAAFRADYAHFMGHTNDAPPRTGSKGWAVILALIVAGIVGGLVVGHVVTKAVTNFILVERP